MVNRDAKIQENLSPSGRVDSIADRGNVFSAGAAARMEQVAERAQCENFSESVREREPGNPGTYASYDRSGYLAAHLERKHTGGPGGSAFDRGSVLPQPPNDGPKR